MDAQNKHRLSQRSFNSSRHSRRTILALGLCLVLGMLAGCARRNDQEQQRRYATEVARQVAIMQTGTAQNAALSSPTATLTLIPAPATATLFHTPTATLTPTPTQTSTATSTATVTPTSTATVTPTSTLTRTATPSRTPTRTSTATSLSTATRTATTGPTKTSTTTPTQTSVASLTFTPTFSPTAKPTLTPTPSATPVDTLTPSPTVTESPTPTATQTQTPTATASPTLVPCIPYPDTGIVPVKDSWIDRSKPDAPHGKDAQLHVRPTGKVDHRALLQFDLSSIPAGSKITSAILYLNDETGGDYLVEFRRVTGIWDESVTWNTQPTIDSTPIGGFTLTKQPCVRAGQIDPKVVQAWLDAPLKNYGLMLYPPTGSGDVIFTSREGSLAPKLVVSYSPSITTDDHHYGEQGAEFIALLLLLNLGLSRLVRWRGKKTH